MEPSPADASPSESAGSMDVDHSALLASLRSTKLLVQAERATAQALRRRAELADAQLAEATAELRALKSRPDAVSPPAGDSPAVDNDAGADNVSAEQETLAPTPAPESDDVRHSTSAVEPEVDIAALEALEEERNAALARVAALEDELMTVEAQCKASEGGLSGKEDELIAITMELDAAKADVKAKGNDLDGLKQDVRRLESELHTSKAELASTRSTLAQTDSRLHASEAELVSSKDELAKVSSRAQESEAQLVSTRDELEEARNQLSSVTADLDGVSEVIATKADECTALVTAQSTLHSKYVALYDEHEKCETELAKLRSALSAAKREVANSHDTCEAHAKELASHLAKIADQEAALVKANRRADAAEAAAEEANKAQADACAAEAGARIAYRAMQFAAAEREANQSAVASSSVHELLDRERVRRQEAEARVLVETEERTKAEEAQLSSLASERELRATVASLEDESVKMWDELKALRAANEDIETENASLRRAADADKNQIKALEEDLRAATTSTAAEHVSRLQERIAALDQLVASGETRDDDCDTISLSSYAPSEASCSSVSAVTGSTSPRSTADGGFRCAPPGGLVHMSRLSDTSSGHEVVGPAAKLAADLRGVKARLKNSNAICADLRQQVGSLTSRCESLDVAHAAAQTEVNGLTQEKAKLQDELRSVKGRLSSAEASSSSAVNRLTTSEAERERATAEAERCASANKELSRSSRLLEVQVEALRKELSAVQSESVSQRDDLEATRKLLSFAQKEIVRLEDERLHLLSGRSARTARGGKGGQCGCASRASSQAGREDAERASFSLRRIQELESLLSTTREDAARHQSHAEALSHSLAETESKLATLQSRLAWHENTAEAGTDALKETQRMNEMQNRSISELKTRLRMKEEESADHLRQIQNDLMPALERAREEARSKASEVAVKVVQLEEVRALSEKTRDLLEEDIASASARLESTRLAMESAQKRLSSAEDRNSELDSTILRLVADVKSRDEKVKALSDDLEHRRAALNALQARVEYVTFACAESEQNAESLRLKLNEVSAQLLHEQDQNTVSRARAERRDEQLVNLQASYDSLEDDFDALRKAHEELRVSSDSQDRMLAALQSSLQVKDRAFMSQARLASEKEDLSNKVLAELRTALSNKDGTLSVLRTENAAAQRQVAAISKQLESAQQQLQELTRELHARSAELSEARSEARRQGERVEQKESSMEKLRQELDGCASDISARDARIASQGTALAEQEGKIAGLRAAVQASSRFVEDLQAEVATAREGMDAVRADLDLERNSVSSLSAKLVQSEADFHKQSMVMKEMEADLSRKCTEIDALGNKLVEQRKRIQELEVVEKNQQGTVERLEHELAVMQGQLEGHDSLLKEYQSAKASLEQTNRKLHEAEELVSSSSAAAAETQEKLTRTAQELTDAREQLSKVETLKSSLERELSGVKESLRSVGRSAHENLASSNAVTEDVRKDLDKTSESLRLTTEQLSRVETEKVALERDLLKSRDALRAAEEATREAQSAQTAIEEELRRELNLCQSQIRMLEGSLETSSKTNEKRLLDLSLERESDAIRLREVQQELASKMEELGSVREDLDEARESLQARDEAVEELEAQLAERETLERRRESDDARGDRRHRNGDAQSGADMSAHKLASKLESREKAIASLHSWCCFINDKLHATERLLADRDAELSVASKTLAKFAERSRHEQDVVERDVAQEVPVRRRGQAGAEVALLLDEIRRMETAIASAKDSASSWRRKFDELRPLADLALEAQRTAADLRTRLQLVENETIQQIDVLTLELESCKADRDLAERECATAVGENTAMRRRLVELEKRGTESSLSTEVSSSRSSESLLFHVTFFVETSGPVVENGVLAIIGSDPSLGGWDVRKRQPLRKTQSDNSSEVWSCQILLTRGTVVEFKYVAITPAGHVMWEAGSNRSLDLTGASPVAHVQGHWRS